MKENLLYTEVNIDTLDIGDEVYLEIPSFSAGAHCVLKTIHDDKFDFSEFAGGMDAASFGRNIKVYRIAANPLKFIPVLNDLIEI